MKDWIQTIAAGLLLMIFGGAALLAAFAVMIAPLAIVAYVVLWIFGWRA